MPTKVRVGKVAKLYYKVGGLSAGGSWVLLDRVNDAQFSLTAEEADVTTRAGNGFVQRVVTLLDLEFTFSIVNDDLDPNVTALKNAALDSSIIAFRALSALEADGGQGPQADCQLFGFDRSEGIRDAQIYSVTAKVTLSDTAPSWYPS